jgi:tetratricopeptide (TPR) repeat protein
MAIQERMGLDLDLVYSLDTAGVMAMTEDDLGTAERLLQRALAARDRLKMAPVATLQNLAELRWAQGRVREARELIGRSLAAAHGGLDEGYAHEVEVRILLAAGDPEGADRALAQARKLTGGRVTEQLDLDAARVLLARGRTRQAIAMAQRARASADQLGVLATRIDADGVLGAAELRARIAGGEPHMRRAIQEAAARGYALMSRQLLELHDHIARAAAAR